MRHKADLLHRLLVGPFGGFVRGVAVGQRHLRNVAHRLAATPPRPVDQQVARDRREVWAEVSYTVEREPRSLIAPAVRLSAQSVRLTDSEVGSTLMTMVRSVTLALCLPTTRKCKIMASLIGASATLSS